MPTSEQVVMVDGVEVPDFGQRRYPYGVIEVTQRCNLRCKTCFFFQAFQHQQPDMPVDEMLDKLRALQRRHQIKFMSWVGGEPLLRMAVVEAAPDIFPANVVFTNGIRAIPDVAVAFAVSLDGPQEINDEVRGSGVYDKARRSIREAPRPVFIQTVVSRRNASALESFTSGISGWKNVRGVIFSIYVPQLDDDSGLSFPQDERDGLIERMLQLVDRHGSFILNERRALELALSPTCKQVTDACDMKVNSLALDYRLQRRLPCCYGENVDCDRCAAPTPFSRAVTREAQRAGVQTDGFPQALRRAMGT